MSFITEVASTGVIGGASALAKFKLGWSQLNDVQRNALLQKDVALVISFMKSNTNKPAINSIRQKYVAVGWGVNFDKAVNSSRGNVPNVSNASLINTATGGLAGLAQSNNNPINLADYNVPTTKPFIKPMYVGNSNPNSNTDETVIEDVVDLKSGEESKSNTLWYVLGGIGAVVLIIAGVVIYKKMKAKS